MTATEPAPCPAAPEPLSVLAAFVAIPLGGGMLGALVGVVTAPGSEAAVAVGIFTLPVAYGLGLSAWRALLAAWLATILGRSALRSGGSEQRFRAETIRSLAAIRERGPGGLPFSWVFVPVGLAVGLAAGALLVLLTAGAGAAAGALLLVAASAQGVLLTRLARAGRLPLPED